MKHLKKLAKDKGITVIAVIHQPSSVVFQLCDDVFLMSRGQCLYNGPAQDLGSHLFKFGFQCQPFYNIAEFAIEVACGERGSDLSQLVEEAKKCHTEKFGEFYQEKQLKEEETEVTPTEQTPILKSEGDSDVRVCFTKTHNTSVKALTRGSVQRYPISIFRQFTILFMRCTYCINRDMQLSILRVFTHIIVGFLLGILYYDFGNDADKVYSNFSFIFFNVLFLFFGTAMPTVLTYTLSNIISWNRLLFNWTAIRVFSIFHVMASLCSCIDPSSNIWQHSRCCF
uniref:ABC-2 type transporter transmembrane domain-containing protein n=1 Tax=Clastoptera arizonana TaxID=38151 RepID=A0A1B6E7K8_9HEMI